MIYQKAHAISHVSLLMLYPTAARWNAFRQGNILRAPRNNNNQLLSGSRAKTPFFAVQVVSLCSALASKRASGNWELHQYYWSKGIESDSSAWPSGNAESWYRAGYGLGRTESLASDNP